MIICMHKLRGGQNVRAEVCGKRATHVVPKIIEQCAGHDIELQVCGVHRRFWEARGFCVAPLGATP